MTKNTTSASSTASGIRWARYSLAAVVVLAGGASCDSVSGWGDQSETRASAARARAEVEIVVHRGANHLAPENTLAAAQACVDRDLGYVEVDVRTSKDGVLYILHDRTLDRTTNGTGAIRDRLSSYIDTLDAGSWFGVEFAGQRVPRLEVFLKKLRGKIGLYFDVKDADLKQLIELVYASGFEGNSFFWFKDDAKAHQLTLLDANLKPKMTTQHLEGLNRAIANDPQIIECRLEALTPGFVSFCRRHGLQIMINALRSNSEEDYRRILSSPADMVNLNDVDLMMSLMDSRLTH